LQPIIIRDAESLICCTQIYRVLGTVVHLAMSADSSCRGLRSARDGPVVMELTQGRFDSYNVTAHIGEFVRYFDEMIIHVVFRKRHCNSVIARWQEL